MRNASPCCGTSPHEELSKSLFVDFAGIVLVDRLHAEAGPIICSNDSTVFRVDGMRFASGSLCTGSSALTALFSRWLGVSLQVQVVFSLSKWRLVSRDRWLLHVHDFGRRWDGVFLYHLRELVCSVSCCCAWHLHVLKVLEVCGTVDRTKRTGNPTRIS